MRIAGMWHANCRGCRGTDVANPRVVVIHKDGLRRIIGEFNPEEDEAYALIEFTAEMAMEGPRCSRAGLIGVGPKIVLYREIV
jgi:hypothetical protein